MYPKADKSAAVIVDKNRYSVSNRLVGRTLRVICHVDKVEIFAQGQRVTGHGRLFTYNQWQLDPDQYLELVQQCPLAFNSARLIRDWKKRWPKPCGSYWSASARLMAKRGIKAFIEVLLLFRHHPAEEVQQAIATAIKAEISASGGVLHLLHRNQPTPQIVPLERYSWLPEADISVYGHPGGGK